MNSLTKKTNGKKYNEKSSFKAILIKYDNKKKEGKGKGQN